MILNKIVSLLVGLCFINTYPMNFATTTNYNADDYSWTPFDFTSDTNAIPEEIPPTEQDTFIIDVDDIDIETVSVEAFRDTIRTMQLEGNAQGIREQEAILAQEQPNATNQEKRDIINEFLSDPLTQILDTIKNATPEVAARELGHLQMQLLLHFEKSNFSTMAEAKADMIDREGADLLQVSDACHRSRADYKENIIEQKLEANKNTSSQFSNAQNSIIQSQHSNNQIKPTYASSVVIENISSHSLGPCSKSRALGSKFLQGLNKNNNSSQTNSQNNFHDYKYAYAGIGSSATVTNNSNNNCEMSMSASSVVINILNPIISILGETVGLATFNIKNCVIDGVDPITNTPLPQQVTPTSKELPERIYYESRRKELLDLKQKFEAVQTGLKDACRYQNNNLLGMGFNYLKSLTQSHIKSVTQTTFDAELKLNEVQKEQLREIRQTELQQIEQSIIDIQHNIVFLFKELIEQKNEAVKDYHDSMDDFVTHVNNYNQSLKKNNNISVDIRPNA